MPVAVNVDDFVRAESDRMFASLAAEAGGVNRLRHNRAPTPVESQPVIRMNRDTLYSAAIVDISAGARLTIPDAGDRYVSVMVVRYIGVEPRLPVGEYELTVRDVPVDGFWSISVYNRDGYVEPNARGAYSVNNLTATPNADGSVTVHFGGDDDRPNLIPIMDGWNYTVRLYRPRAEVLDGSWTFPAVGSV